MEILKYGLVVALAITLVFAAINDIRHRRIENWVTGAIALTAPVFWIISGMSIWPDMVTQLGFALLVSAILIGLYWLGTKVGMLFIGGGDVKFLGALSLWFAPLAFVDLLIVMAAVGGLVAVGFVIRRAVFKPKKPGTLPYGVAISIGALWVLGWTYIPAATQTTSVALG